MPADHRKTPTDELLRKASWSNTQNSRGAPSELKLRVMQAQLESAEAAKASAEYAKQSVRWMFWSVVVLATASVASFVLDMLNFLNLQ